MNEKQKQQSYRQRMLLVAGALLLVLLLAGLLLWGRVPLSYLVLGLSLGLLVCYYLLLLLSRRIENRLWSCYARPSGQRNSWRMVLSYFVLVVAAWYFCSLLKDAAIQQAAYFLLLLLVLLIACVELYNHMRMSVAAHARAAAAQSPSSED